MIHIDFDLVFSGEHRFQLRDSHVVVTPRLVGTLQIRSGKIVCCDPLSAYELEPLAAAVPHGDHPVTLAIARIDDEDERVAAALVRFSSQPVAKWVLATCEGEDVRTLEGDSFFGYGVDAGTGCFADGAGAQGLTDESTQDELIAALTESQVNTWGFATAPLPSGSVVAFSSGWGDGSYASFWGLSATSERVALATDFAVLLVPVERVIHVPRSAWKLGAIALPGLEGLGATLTAEAASEGSIPEFVLESRRDAEVKLVDAQGERLMLEGSMESQGSTRRYAFRGAVPGDARLEVRVLEGLRPLKPL